MLIDKGTCSKDAALLVLLDLVRISAPGKGTVNPDVSTQERPSVVWQDIHAICEWSQSGVMLRIEKRRGTVC